MSRAILFVVLLCFVSKTFGKTLSECELVRELRKHGFPENQLKDCITDTGTDLERSAVEWGSLCASRRGTGQSLYDNIYSKLPRLTSYHQRDPITHFCAGEGVCLVNAESSRRTNVVGGPNSDGSHDYGLFQINDRYWCSSTDKPGKGCNVRCKDLLLDDISKQAQCTKTVFGVHGFEAWYGWVNKCKGRPLPDIHC